MNLLEAAGPHTCCHSAEGTKYIERMERFCAAVEDFTNDNSICREQVYRTVLLPRVPGNSNLKDTVMFRKFIKTNKQIAYFDSKFDKYFL